MTMDFSFKTLAKIAAAATSILAVAGVIAAARPYLQSDAPPLASQTRVQQVDNKIVLLAQNFQMMQRQQLQSEQNQAFLAQGFWTNQLIQAQQMLRQNPNNLAARQQAAFAQQQLSGIQKQLYGGR